MAGKVARAQNTQKGILASSLLLAALQLIRFPAVGVHHGTDPPPRRGQYLGTPLPLVTMGPSAATAGPAMGTGCTGHYPAPSSISRVTFTKLLPRPPMPLQAAEAMLS